MISPRLPGGEDGFMKARICPLPRYSPAIAGQDYHPLFLPVPGMSGKGGPGKHRQKLYYSILPEQNTLIFPAAASTTSAAAVVNFIPPFRKFH